MALDNLCDASLSGIALDESARIMLYSGSHSAKYTYVVVSYTSSNSYYILCILMYHDTITTMSSSP